jgi:DNA-binding IclR family transcriptional regulator
MRTDRYLTIADIAHHCQASPASVRRWLRSMEAAGYLVLFRPTQTTIRIDPADMPRIGAFIRAGTKR